MGTSRDVIFDEDRRYQDLPVPRKTGSLDDVLEWHDEWSLVEDRDEERGDQWSGEGVGAAGAEEAAGPVGVEGEGGLTKDGSQEERQADDRRVVESAEKDAGDVAELDADAEGVGDGGEMEEDEEPDETAHLEQLLLRAQIDGLPSSEEVEEAMAPAISDPNRQAPSDPQTQPQDSPPAPTATAAPPDRIPEAERAHIKRIRESREPTRRSPRLHQQHGQAKMVRAL
ncbi:unnamed protein product [Tilletia controversa]|nr:unnamed protein product [Tilletia controversa]